MAFVYAVIVALIVIAAPNAAHAWGPGMHVEIALGAMSKLAVISPVIADLMRRFPDAFIYGAASPDIIMGKRYYGYLHHCHNWTMGRLILAEAQGDLQRTAAYGYLMHLAADVVAHNYYIPVKIVRSWSTRLLTHTYWEMRFDVGVSDRAWKKLGSIGKPAIERFDLLLERVLKKTLFSFSTNKRIFNSIVMLQKMRGLRASLAAYARRSRFPIEEENRSHYMDLAMDAAIGFLKDPEHAPCLDIDPAGLSRLDYAARLRLGIRASMKKGLMREPQAEKLVELVKDGLALGLYRPNMVLPGVMDVL